MKFSQILAVNTRAAAARAEVENVELLKSALAAKDIDPETGTFEHSTKSFTNTAAKSRHGFEVRVETTWIAPGSTPVGGGE